MNVSFDARMSEPAIENKSLTRAPKRSGQQFLEDQRHRPRSAVADNA